MIYLATRKINSATYHYFYKKKWIYQVDLHKDCEDYTGYCRWQHINDDNEEIEAFNFFRYTLPKMLNIINIPNDSDIYYPLDDIITNKILESI